MRYKLAIAYTINDPLKAQELQRWGVDGFFSDKPDLIKEGIFNDTHDLDKGSIFSVH